MDLEIEYEAHQKLENDNRERLVKNNGMKIERN